MAGESESEQYCILLCVLLSVLSTYVLRSTKVFRKVTGAGYYDKLQAILTTAAPELDKALQDLSDDDCALFLPFLSVAGFEPTARMAARNRGARRTVATWTAPTLENWSGVYESLLDLERFVDEKRDGAQTGAARTVGAEKRGSKRKTPAAEPQGLDDLLADTGHEEFDPNTQQQPERTTRTNTVGITPADVARNPGVQATLQRLTQGDTALTRAGAGGLAGEASSKWDLPKPLTSESEVQIDAQGNLKHTKRKLHTREMWMSLAIQTMLQIARTGEVEKFPYHLYVEMCVALGADFPWWIIMEWDDLVRRRIARGDLEGFDTARLHTEFLIKHGHWLVSAGNRNGATVNNGGGSGGGGRGGGTRAGRSQPPAGKTCHFFNSKKGCDRDPCTFAHKCSKCGGPHPRSSCGK